jgi:beta-galactosidase
MLTRFSAMSSYPEFRVANMRLASLYRHTFVPMLVGTVLCFGTLSRSRAAEVALATGWKFHRGDVAAAETTAFDDAGWRSVDLPHDWSIEGNGPGSSPSPHDQATPDGPSVGYLRGGIGWYRLHVPPSAPVDDPGAELVIDGAQQEADVWVNGTHVAFQPHGYIPIRAEIGKLLTPGHDNVIAVRVVNPEANSRWYSGAGLYRQARLRYHGATFIPTWGAQVDTLWISAPRAQLQVRVTVQNDDAVGRDIAIQCRLTSPSGQASEHPCGVIRLAAGQREVVNTTIELAHAELWQPDAPRQYAAEFSVVENGRTLDTLSTRFGVRTVHVDAERGFLLNGQPLKLRGACLHHDNGILGAAAFPEAELRRVRLMKENGFNAIRTSHNPPSSAFLDACDREGLLVIDEFADSWELPKKQNGYQRYFDRHWEADFSAMLHRDFNHPSVVIWSIGNEIPERFSGAGVQIAKRLVDLVHRVDPRRPTTNAINTIWEDPNLAERWKGNHGALGVLDVGGYNYTWREYRADHAASPRWVMAGTESYPKEAYEIWREVDALPYVIGDFVWTGMDYIGESGIGHTTYIDAKADPSSTGPKDWESSPWPCWISWCGDLDITGVKKPQSYYRDVVWGRSPLELAVHEPVPEGKQEKVGAWGWPAERLSWNWPGQEGRPLQVSVYSRAKRVTLALNGRLIGDQTIDPAQGITAHFTVPWTPGTLTATAYDGAQVVATKALRTTGPAAHLRLEPEARALRADREALLFVRIAVVDANGAVVPNATFPLTCAVEGAAELSALGSGDPEAVDSLVDPTTRTFRGQALAILRSTGKPGPVRLTVSSTGLDAATLEVKADAVLCHSEQ